MGRSDLRKFAQDRMEELKQAQGLDDQRPRCNYFKRKQEAIVRTYKEPVWPKLGKILFFSMLLIVFVTLLAEVSTYLRYSSHLGLKHLLSNLTTTGLGIWGIYSVLLLPVCALGCHTNSKRFHDRQEQNGIQDLTPEDHARSARAIRRLNRSYMCYFFVCTMGLGVWISLYLVIPH